MSPPPQEPQRLGERGRVSLSSEALLEKKHLNSSAKFTTKALEGSLLSKRSPHSRFLRAAERSPRCDGAGGPGDSEDTCLVRTPRSCRRPSELRRLRLPGSGQVPREEGASAGRPCSPASPRLAYVVGALTAALPPPLLPPCPDAAGVGGAPGNGTCAPGAGALCTCAQGDPTGSTEGLWEEKENS